MRRLAAVLALSLIPALAASGARRAPGFSLPDVNGQQHDLADYRGRVVIVEITRTECPSCEGFAAKLEQLKTYYAGKVAVIAITNPPDTVQAVTAYIAEHKLTYPMLFDCGQVAFSYVLPNQLRPSINIPHIYIVDREGMIRRDLEFGTETTEFFLGDGLYKVLDELLAGTPAAAQPPAAKPGAAKPARK